MNECVRETGNGFALISIRHRTWREANHIIEASEREGVVHGQGARECEWTVDKENGE